MKLRRHRIADRHQHPVLVLVGPRESLQAVPAPVDVEQGLHRLASGGDEMPKAVRRIGYGRSNVGMWHGRVGAPAVFVDPGCVSSYAGWPFVESVVGEGRLVS